MRIRTIEIKNFKAFHGEYQIDLAGKNLLVYGENGSGKSSLFLALKLFLESAVDNHQFGDHKNIFFKSDSADDSEDYYIRLHLAESDEASPTTYEWSTSIQPPLASVVTDAAKIKGFLDYKALLETHYIHRGPEVNLFDLLVGTILSNAVNDITQSSFGVEWTNLQQSIPARMTPTRLKQLETNITNFNNGLKAKLVELEGKTNDILRKFGYPIEVGFIFEKGVAYDKASKEIANRIILLQVKRFVDRPLPAHHHFFNEAKLTAIAISVYLASVLVQPPTTAPKILALDDVLIGLDMSNRMPMLDILEAYFATNFQILMFTYDKFWFEVIKQRMEPTKNWRFLEMYAKRLSDNDFEIPFIQDNIDFIEKAEAHLQQNDYKSTAIYLRSAFEKLVKTYCRYQGIKVVYKTNSNEYKSEDFWKEITEKEKDRLDVAVAQGIETWRKAIMNPLSHYDLEKPEFRGEVEQAIKAVKALNTALENLKKTPGQKALEELQKKQ